MAEVATSPRVIGPTSAAGRAGAAVAGTLGAGSAAVFGLVRHLRRRPLHPRGVVLRGTLTIEDVDVPGVRELGGPGERDVRVRVSRAVGLPSWLPDNQGLALTWDADGRRHDLLLAGSGLSRVGRFTLVPRRRPTSGPLSTMMPFVSPSGVSMMMAAVPRRTSSSRGGTHLEPAAGGGVELTVLAAGVRGPWHRIGMLSCPPSTPDQPPADDPDLRFDPVANVPGTLSVPAWAARVRVPVYRRSRA